MGLSTLPDSSILASPLTWPIPQTRGTVSRLPHPQVRIKLSHLPPRKHLLINQLPLSPMRTRTPLQASPTAGRLSSPLLHRPLASFGSLLLYVVGNRYLGPLRLRGPVEAQPMSRITNKCRRAVPLLLTTNRNPHDP